MNQGKDIKVYGTLVNHTVDNTIGDGQLHNDKLAVARQLYDDQFGESTKVNNFQDIINKRIKGITRKTSGSDAGTHVNEDLYVGNPSTGAGDIYLPDGHGGWKKLVIPEVPDLTDILNRLAFLESLWEISGEYIQPKNLVKKVKGPGFFDSTVN